MLNRSRYLPTMRVFVLFPLLAASALAWQSGAVCGTSPMRDRQTLALHQAWQKSSEFRRLRTAELSGGARALANRDIGNIAIIADSGGVVARRNPFNESQRTIRFTPAGPVTPGYRYESLAGGYDASLATAGTPLDLGDDDTRQVNLPFAFFYFGQTYTKAYVNSDGNLTFGQGDTSTDDRSVGRANAGPPRIAGLYRDLDATRPGASILAFADANRFVITWVNVPDYQASGFAPVQTFQIRLYADSHLEFSYSAVGTASAVVGLSPGGSRDGAAVVSFLTQSSTVYSAALLEYFTSNQEIDEVFAAQRFYETHGDAYDYLVFYNNVGIDDPSAVAYALAVRNTVTGNGSTAADFGSDYGSPKRLQTVINMGTLSQYPSSPYATPVPRRPMTGDTALSLLAHETGHRFLAYTSVTDSTGGGAPMQRSDGGHWAFTYNADASVMEGVRIQDNGVSAVPRFTTADSVSAYSVMDQYLMGFRPPTDVPPSFYVANATASPQRFPEKGVSFDGTRRDFTVDDLIRVAGRRTPDDTVAQRRFRFAIVLITAAGVDPPASDLDKIDSIRREFETYFAALTGGRAIADTALQKNVDLSLWPNGGLIEGTTAQATISLDSAPAAPLVFNLRAPNGVLSVPPSVTIPAGQSQAAFSYSGLRSGVEDVSVEPTDPSYSQVNARVQVRSSGALTLNSAGGNNQVAVPGRALASKLVARVADINRIPFAGVEVNASVTGGGSVAPTKAITNDLGEAVFEWTAGSDASQTLTAALPNGNNTAFTAAVKPFAPPNGIANNASGAPGMVAGSIASIYGVNLAGGRTAGATLPLQTSLAGATLSVNGTAALLFYVSDDQINFLVPPGTSTGAAVITVASGNPQQTLSVQEVAVNRLQPGIYQQGASTVGAILVYSDHLEIYATGLGPVAASPALPGLQETTTRPQVQVGGQSVAVLYSGPAPGYAGVYQINVARPIGMTGSRSVSMIQGGMVSNTVTVDLN